MALDEPARPPGAGKILLVSCYELGHQPLSIGLLAARLEPGGHEIFVADLSVEPVDEAVLARSALVVISVPMHTALRLGVELAERIRLTNPRVHICLFGLYAWMSGVELLKSVADSIVGGQFVDPVAELANRLFARRPIDSIDGLTTRRRLLDQGCLEPPLMRGTAPETPQRDVLPPLERYAELVGPAPGERRLVGYVEASTGCKYRCRHCPVVPVFDGRFFVTPVQIVLADVRQQTRAGARHITFGDPDFMNGIGHALKVARALHAEHPNLTFDVTVKVQHIIEHRAHFAELAELGCLFVVSAIESLSDKVLQELDKGHTRADVFEALAVTRRAGIHLRPSFVAFTPWSTLDDYIDLVDFVFEHGLAHNVDPIQLAIRLLVPSRSALLWPARLRASRRPAGMARGDGAELDSAAPPAWLGAFDQSSFSYRWQHPDLRLDTLHQAVTNVVELGAREGRSDYDTLVMIRKLAFEAADRPSPALPPPPTNFVPRLTEPWFCCAEPTAAQFEQIVRRQCHSDCTSGCSKDAAPQPDTLHDKVSV